MKSRSTPAFLMAIPALAFTALANGQTLYESIATALDKSPTVMKSVEQAKMAAAEVGVVKSARLPQISLDASAGPAYRDRSIDGLEDNTTGDALFSTRAGVSLQQLLFDWGASGNVVESARLRQAFEELLVTDALETEAFNVAQTYFEIFRLRGQLVLLRQRVNDIETFRKIAVDRKTADGELDAAVLAGRLAGAQADVDKITARLGTMEKRFEILTTLSPKHVSLASIKLPVGDTGFVNSSTNPRVRAAEVAVGSARKGYDAAVKDRYPKFFLQVNGGVGNDVLGIEGPDNELSALAVMRWDIWDGGRRSSTMSKAAAEVNRQAAIVNQIRQVIETDIAGAAEDLRGAVDRYENLSKSLTGLSKAVDLQRQTLQNDPNQAGRLLTTSAAVGELNSARRDLVDAEVDRYIAAYRLLSASGILVEYVRVKGGYRSASASGSK